MTCSGASFADNPANCTHNEYGGRHSPMGSGCSSMTGWERWRSGWLQSCNGVRVKSTGTFTIYPIELPCSGAQVLQIPMAHTRQAPGGLAVTLSHYYVELRGPYGIDTPLKPQILVYASAEQPVSRQIGDLRAWILDQNTSDTTINGWGLGAGQTFNDPAGGVSFTVQSVDATQAVIQVTITSTTVPNVTGDNTCIDGTTVFTPGMSECAPATSRPDGSTTPGGAAGMGGTSGTGGSMGGRGGAGGGAGMAGTAGRGSGGGGGQGGTSGGGTAGSAGNTSGGGASGNSNTAGSSGTGTGGTATAGSSGASAQGGSAGMPSGTAGSSGATGVGGVPLTGGAPTTSTGGAVPVTGTGGSWTGGAPAAPASGVQPPIDAGCACEVGAGARPRGSAWSFAAVGLTLSHWLRRRRKAARGVRDPASRR
jgi:MYXO-CTERM domain-containing protein